MVARNGVIAPEEAAFPGTIFDWTCAGRTTIRPGSALLLAMFHLGLQDARFDFDGDPAPAAAMFEETRRGSRFAEP